MTALLEERWLRSHRGDARAIGLYFRHYSSEKNGRKDSCFTSGFTGPGEDIVLLTPLCDALFVWKRQIRDDGQEGDCCTVFRNEGQTLSSELIREADELAWRWWGNARHFTYVDAGKVRRKRDPGRCFLRAGWNYCGTSKNGLRILERLP